MPFLHEFGPDDVFQNSLETSPGKKFTAYSGSLYIDESRYKGINIGTDSISLYELNVNRHATLDDINSIHAFIVKDGSRSSFRSISTSSYNQEQYGTKLTGAYPITASISRDYIYGGRTYPFAYTIGVDSVNRVDPNTTDLYFSQSKQLLALRSTMDKYKRYSPAFTFSGSKTVDPSLPPYLTGAINLISIPSIFYGSSLEKGTVNLSFYYTGTLMDQCRDEKRNGELISYGKNSSVSGSTVGVVLYDEGFIMLYNEENISADEQTCDSYSGTGSIGEDGAGSWSGKAVQLRPNWTYFWSYNTGSSGSQGIAAAAGVDHAPGGATRTDGANALYPSASNFTIEFNGKNVVPTITMFANAPAGQLNNSQNPTWLSSSHSKWKEQIHFDSSSYIEPKKVPIKNTAESDFTNHIADFEKQTFISKIAIYDDNKNLLGIAKLATPVLKKETDSYTFKLKLDF